MIYSSCSQSTHSRNYYAYYHSHPLLTCSFVSVLMADDLVQKTLPTGLIIEDVKVGDGPIAKTGKRLGMRYVF